MYPRVVPVRRRIGADVRRQDVIEGEVDHALIALQRRGEDRARVVEDHAVSVEGDAAGEFRQEIRAFLDRDRATEEERDLVAFLVEEGYEAGECIGRREAFRRKRRLG